MYALSVMKILVSQEMLNFEVFRFEFLIFNMGSLS